MVNHLDFGTRLPNLHPDMSVSIQTFRKQVIRNTLFTARGLGEAVERLGFIQADPIRSPARAQDLILRQRVRHYRAGDLERRYPGLPLEECFLFAYGFASKDVWRWMHPKPQIDLSDDHRAVLKLLKTIGPLHPRDVESHIGVSSAKNGWGGRSRTSKLILETLHDRGLIRVAKRENGIRVYESAASVPQTGSRPERYQELLLAGLQAMGATTRWFLIKEMGYHGYLAGDRPARQQQLQQLMDDGRVRVDEVEGVEYLSLPATKPGRLNLNRVRILAPFDPVVRDRKRFEHLWGWAYRFEAYVPPAKRTLGYYAMPVLWQDDVVGWANASVQEGELHVDFGYSTGRPNTKAFREAAETEVDSLTRFLGLESGSWKARF